MKKHLKNKIKKNMNISSQSIRRKLRIDGKFLHGTRGKPTNGPRGNKKY